MNEKLKEYINKNKEKIFAITFTLIYAIITAIIAIHHENWRDENQAWLLCRDLSFIDLLKQLKYEGHPILWFSIIYPFAKIGFSCKIVNVLSWIMMVISVYMILKKAPLGKFPRICIILTFPFMYQYVIIGRSYSLIVLLVTLICVLDKNRKQHPILYGIVLALLANTHLIMVGLVGMITITFYLYELIINRKNNTKEENLKIFKGFLIVLTGGILLLIQMLGCLTVEMDVSRSVTIIQLFKNIIENIKEYADFSIYIINVLFLVFILIGIRKYLKETTIFIVSVLFQCIFYSVIGKAKLYMALSIMLILMYTMWSATNRIIKEKKDIKITIVFEVMLIIMSLLSLQQIYDAYVKEYNFNYSSSKEMGTYIYENLDDKIFITATDAECSAIIPYTKQAKFWNINTQSYFTYVTWNNEREKGVFYSDIENIIKNNFSNEDDIYYITCSSLGDGVKKYLEENGKLEEIYVTENSIIEENYILYKVVIGGNINDNCN